MYSLHLRRHPFPHYSGDISGSLSDSHEKLRLVVIGDQAVRFRKIHAGRIIGRTDTVCGFTFTVVHLDRRKCPFYGFPDSGLLAPCRTMVDREHVAVQSPSSLSTRFPSHHLPKPFSMMVVFLLSIYFNTLCSDLTSFGSPTHLYSTSHQLGTAYLLPFLTI